ncbi:hypothetical protein MN116_007163 [Schistosoma mekongi]|uniref:Uncharacterized protein n=1 Tax=Schistosoma mekongi TaxID=38744 RepID=A0AAE2D482_SCHME|nr:hypothetical protein MN116_007163 [Schistosoma mekongi]
MTKPIDILILCDCKESLSAELNDLRKQFTDESNTVKLTDLCDYFSDHILSNSDHFCDLFITFLDLISAHDMTVFLFSESYKCSPNEISEPNSTSFMNSDKIRTLLSHKRLNVYDYEDWKSIGFIVENEVAKLKQIFQLKSLIYENNENYKQSPGFISSKHADKLEDILDRFCLSAFEDEDNYITPVNNILDLYKLEDWSHKLKRSDQRLRDISTKTKHDSSWSRILLITDQPGVGKTRFLTNWINKRRSNGFNFMHGDTKIKELITIKNVDEIESNSLSSKPDIIFIETFIEPNTRSSDIWQLLDDLNQKARKARCKGKELNLSLATLLSGLTSEQEDFERARQLRQLGSRLFASLKPVDLNENGSLTPVIVIIDGLEYLEDPLAKSPEGVKCIDWLFSCHVDTKEPSVNEYGGINSGGLPNIPSRTRFIFTCSSSHYINRQLTKCPLINVIKYSNILGLKGNTFSKPLLTPIGNLEETEDSKENNLGADQRNDLFSLFPNLINKDTLMHNDEVEMNNQFTSYSMIRHRLQIMEDRLKNPVINKLYKNWCLKENALARKIFLHELYITSFSFPSIANIKDIFNWHDYIERLLATQSIWQLLLYLLQQWAIEFEHNIITIEEEMSMKISLENRNKYSKLYILSDQKKDTFRRIDFKALLRKSMTQLSKDWTLGLVGLVFHTLVAAFQFTWSKEDKYLGQGESSGFKFQDILHILNHINLPQYYVHQSILPSTIMALHSPLLNYYCLRIFHRAGAFSQRTDGGILNQTTFNGYLKFNHEIVHSVMRQLLARDNDATGVHLPLITTAFQWCKGTEQNNGLLSILLRGCPQDIAKESHQSLVNYSSQLIENNIYKSKPKITFKNIGHKIQVALSLIESDRMASINNQPPKLKSFNQIDNSDTLLIPMIQKHSTSLRASLQLVPDTYRIAIKFSDLFANHINIAKQQLSLNNCAHMRHILLLTEFMNYLVTKPNYPIAYGFLSSLMMTQIEIICIVNDLYGIKIILNNMEFILLHPCFLLCLAFSTYATDIFTGSITNLHLLVAFWHIIDNSFTLINKYCDKDKIDNNISSSDSDVINETITDGKIRSNNYKAVKRSTSKLYELAQSALEYLQHKSCPRENNVKLPGENNLESLTWIIGELMYGLGNELESVQTLSKLAKYFINCKTLNNASVLQLSHLGLSIVRKLRYLKSETDESMEDSLTLYQSVVYETELKTTEYLNESSILLACNEENFKLTEQRISTALAYIKMYRLESVIGLTENDNQQLNLFEYQIRQTIHDIEQFNSQSVDRTLVAFSMYLLAKIRLLQTNISEHESLILQAISECMADQGEYHPLLAEWLVILALSLQKPLNDDNQCDEVNFLRMTFGRAHAQACLRWSLDIMTYNQEILVRPVIHPPVSVLSTLKEQMYTKLHRSILLRLPRYLIIPQIQGLLLPSSSTAFYSKASKNISSSLNNFSHRTRSKLSSSRTDITLDFSNDNKYMYNNSDTYQTLPAEICLQLVVCLLRDKRHINLQEAITCAAFVLHEKILFLGAEHPATIQISRILDYTEHHLVHGLISKQIRDTYTNHQYIKSTKSKRYSSYRSDYLFSTNCPSHDESSGRNFSMQRSDKHIRLSSRNPILDEELLKYHLPKKCTRQSEMNDRPKPSGYETNLKLLGKIHRFLSKKINESTSIRKYTNLNHFVNQSGNSSFVQCNRI